MWDPCDMCCCEQAPLGRRIGAPRAVTSRCRLGKRNVSPDVSGIVDNSKDDRLPCYCCEGIWSIQFHVILSELISQILG
ncbi:hypothetical protein ACOSP7_024581 [Xanthoceras sorbifolium]